MRSSKWFTFTFHLAWTTIHDKSQSFQRRAVNHNEVRGENRSKGTGYVGIAESDEDEGRLRWFSISRFV